MDHTKQFELLISKTARGNGPRQKRYTPLDDGMSLLIKIHKMKSHLTKYGHDYLNTYGCLPGATIMTDERRSKLDHDVEDFINVCNDKMKIFESEFSIGAATEQIKEHREAAIDIMKRILKEFINYYNQLRMTRMQRVLEKQRYDRIEIIDGHTMNTINELTLDNIDLEALAKEDKQTSTTQSHSFSFEDFHQQSLIAAENHISISPEEVQSLALENSQIHEELLTLDDEVKSISKKVVQLSLLQELFTEKVMEQEIELNNLHETAIRSSENVRVGNNLIRDAMMKNASTRVFILFYIVTLGFTILFLDWYNP